MIGYICKRLLHYQRIVIKLLNYSHYGKIKSESTKQPSLSMSQIKPLYIWGGRNEDNP